MSCSFEEKLDLCLKNTPPPYSLEKASFLFQETSPLFNEQASSLIQESSLVLIHWKKVHLCLTKCHPSWHQQT